MKISVGFCVFSGLTLKYQTSQNFIGGALYIDSIATIFILNSQFYVSFFKFILKYILNFRGI